MPLILVIDDDDDVRDTVCELLQMAGYEVAAAPNGRVGLQMLSERAADVVITDLFMPEMEGIETIVAVRASRPWVPIIAMSGGGKWDTVQSLKTAHQLGAMETLPKPITFDALMRALRSALGEDAPAAAR